MEKLAIDGGSPVRTEPFPDREFGDEEIAELTDVIKSGVLGRGPKVHEFERAFADLYGFDTQAGFDTGLDTPSGFRYASHSTRRLDPSRTQPKPQPKGVKHCVASTSGTAAIHIAVKEEILSISPGRFAELLRAEGIPARANYIGKPLG